MSVLDGPRQEWRRILHEGQPKWVRPDGDRLLLGDGRSVGDAEATYLPPCDPTKILCIHLNYDSRRVEFKAPMLETPTYFQKPLTAMNSHRGVLCRPAGHKYLNYEGEVGVIIGKPTRNVSREDAWDYIAGFAPANDVGCQDYRDTDAGLDAAGEGSGRLLSDRSRHCQWRGYSQIDAAHLYQRQGGAGGSDFGNDISDRLHTRRPVAVHHAASRRHHTVGHAEEFAADERGRPGRGRGERARAAVEQGCRSPCARA